MHKLCKLRNIYAQIMHNNACYAQIMHKLCKNYAKIMQKLRKNYAKKITQKLRICV